MGSVGNQKPWVPYMDIKDCSQGFCSLYCRQWCHFFPPPPPFEFPDDSSGPNFSPLVIAIIGILASAFLLVSYYAIISKYCRNRDSSRRENQYPVLESEENQDLANHEPWHVPTNGLDESLIKSITIFKYKKGHGLMEGTDCSVCLGEFQEDEDLRLLPKCSHAFHATCIDTWLKSHSNCPLCRANIVFVSPLPPVSEAPPPPSLPNESLLESSTEIGNVAVEEDIEIGTREGDSHINLLKTPSRQHSGMEDSHVRSSSSEVRDDEGEHIRRRSVSMDYLCPSRLSIADILQINDDEDEQTEERPFPEDVGTSKRPVSEMSRSNNRSRIVHCVTSPPAMKRSFSSGRFLFPKHARGRNIILPL